ncbi:hypothetical protein BGZ76_004459, partial [Entomortierella beljakovae]
MGTMYYRGYGVNKDYKKAMTYFLQAAEHGNKRSFIFIGDIFKDGLGVPQDYSLAIEYYLKARDMGVACLRICNLYYYGYGLDRDYTKAIEWYRNAYECYDICLEYTVMFDEYNIDLTHPENSNILEIFLRFIIEGLDKREFAADVAKIILGSESRVPPMLEMIYILAAESGSSSAQSSIGEMYLNGYGVEQDYTKAMEWFRKAASQSDAKALFNIGHMY